MHRYGYGETPTHEPLASRQELLVEIRKRLRDITEYLYPGATFSDVARLHNFTRPLIEKALTNCKETLCGAETLRAVMLNYMVHIGGIRDSLVEVERELWVLLQLTHDPRLVYRSSMMPMPVKKGPRPGRSNTAKAALGDTSPALEGDTARRRKERRTAIRKAIKEGRPLPADAQPAIIMPFRILRALDKPESNEIPNYDNLTPAERQRRADAAAAIRAKKASSGGIRDRLLAAGANQVRTRRGRRPRQPRERVGVGSGR